MRSRAAKNAAKNRRRKMNHHFTTELGRMRTQEQIVRADRYRLAQQVRKSQSESRSRLSWSRSFAFRRTLAAAGLSALILVAFGSVAQGMPMDPEGGSSSIVAEENESQVSAGQPVRSDHAFIPVSQVNPNAEALKARAEHYRDLTQNSHAEAVARSEYWRDFYTQQFGGADAEAVASSAEYWRDYYTQRLGGSDPNAEALAQRADYWKDYYTERLAGTVVSTDAVAQARALNEPTSVSGVDIVAQLRALNQPSVGAPVDAVAQARALNEPSTPTHVASLGASQSPDSDFPLSETVTVIAGILILGAGALMVISRSQQSPKPV
jgi:hypothetical protein